MAVFLLLVTGLLNRQEADGCIFPFFLVCKEPPYKVEESGYAGFIMPIEVYFKNKVGSLSSNRKDAQFTTEEVEPVTHVTECWDHWWQRRLC